MRWGVTNVTRGAGKPACLAVTAGCCPELGSRRRGRPPQCPGQAEDRDNGDHHHQNRTDPMNHHIAVIDGKVIGAARSLPTPVSERGTKQDKDKQARDGRKGNERNDLHE